MRAAPGNPEAWDLTTVAGAAFARYVREASDYARRRGRIVARAELRRERRGSGLGASLERR